MSKARKLRQWQQSCVAKALDYLLLQDGREFLISAAPASGKTTAAIEIAVPLMERGEIETVIVIAPKTDVVNDWATDFQSRTGQTMTKITGIDKDVLSWGTHFCTTWSSIQNLSDEMREICRTKKVLLIADEQHHAAMEASWGMGAQEGGDEAKFVLILTGTPVRSDGAETVWLALDENGSVAHPYEGTFSLTYGQAVDAGYCRPITFHRHVGKFSVQLDNKTRVEVGSEQETKIPKEYERIPGLKNALEFAKLIKQPAFFPHGSDQPDMNGYQASMLREGIAQLEKTRFRMPNAGGLVIANTIEMADYMAKILEKLEGEKPVIVNSKLPNADKKIAAFRRGKQKWLVSVSMVSEGTDITRLRVLVYLPNASTELYFRQAMGRVIRTKDSDDDTRAYVVMPNLNLFDEYARRVEDELPPRFKNESKPKTKKCSVCHTENALSASHCCECAEPFEGRKPEPPATVSCPACGEKTPKNKRNCTHCGENLSAEFVLSLKEAMRSGVIVRGMDINEEDAVKGAEIAEGLRGKLLTSGDSKLVDIVRQLPDESWGRLAQMMENATRSFNA
ncbi:DEAD/DEAH box helicase family protein [Alteromonas sp. McT4-15]|uniref:DEAD/DEAH box helicase n=1 Tax=Alteromonas sp. McT4-15 TaxID=2881256 RepID=UPI001CF8D4C2|nr:DEAD/DEAH box helicase family protein [Alteromonas sp. McT4-15]MCB4435548.1 DEAD/DEAH box helicase family protein [Alteromonas sp. McT4-15]